MLTSLVIYWIAVYEPYAVCLCTSQDRSILLPAHTGRIKSLSDNVQVFSCLMYWFSEIEVIFFTAPAIVLLLGLALRDFLAVTEQYLHSAKVFSASDTLPVSTLEWQEIRREHSQDSWLQLTKGEAPYVWHHAQHIKLEGGRRVGCLE